MNFTSKLRETTINNAKVLEAKSAKIQEWIDNDRFTGSPYQKEQITAAQNERAEALNAAVTELEQITETFIDETAARFMPKGSELTEDAAIFTSGIKLTEAEIKRYVDKYADNKTMLRIISAYADLHEYDIKAMIPFVATQGETEAAAKMLLSYCKSALTDTSYLATFINDEANYKKICGVLA